MTAEFDALIRSWRDRTRGPGEKRRTYLAFVALLPHPPLPVDEDD